ncbi:MAG: outer membrane lipoprotein-sorting protein [Methanosarcina mazei]|jgi:outer membrane lipoprotein-sorting protein|uniref:Outer membrane lipoprotein-sorting protein n=3 Tax=Methanosarcina mazei TaxID=2209 RepID=A0A0E3RMC7_METMZ|nr:MULTISPECIES: outer membrane lipoprotein-sorting protein [Methanosarcina]AAM32139.1 conserved protein [Methanosarcina mazei Go1]AKB65457.1 Outer membrane lipoprotein-sorting protein [Methanosarcina mazei S-6]AKB69387.1 Outer membrane lipoprotein-sorting protein [Methanosarcina mazei LYC]WIM45853.1 outer membrane lipoprotein-sorting protein [Methanosarcina mazei]
MASKKSLFLAFTIIIFAIIYCGFEERANSESISKNLINKQQDIYDISYDEKLTMFIGNESIITESSFLIKNPNMYKRVDRVNSSTCLTIGSDGILTWEYDPITNKTWLINDTSQNSIQTTPTYSEFINSISDNCTINYKGIEYLGEVKTYKLEVISSKLNEPESWSRLLWIDPKIWMPLKIQSYNGDKLLMTLEYENYSINSGIKDTEFKFKPIEGTEVINI